MYRGECYCTDDPGNPVNVSDCGYNCFGDPTSFCGGEKNGTRLHSVYGTGRWNIFLPLMISSVTIYYVRPKVPRAGSWSAWGSLRLCGSEEDCVYTRTRTCDSPTPFFGGQCEGEAEYKGGEQLSSSRVIWAWHYNPPAPQARGGLKEIIQFFSYRLAKPLKPIKFPKVEKSDANSHFSGQK